MATEVLNSEDLCVSITCFVLSGLFLQIFY